MMDVDCRSLGWQGFKRCFVLAKKESVPRRRNYIAESWRLQRNPTSRKCEPGVTNFSSEAGATAKIDSKEEKQISDGMYEMRSITTLGILVTPLGRSRYWGKRGICVGKLSASSEVNTNFLGSFPSMVLRYLAWKADCIALYTRLEGCLTGV
tara:strand:- start:222 stop:677 length:456 start_codon:yes stop_codon:yes gene_type:complete